MTKPIRFTMYSRMKFAFLREHGFDLDEGIVIKTIREPDAVVHGRMGRRIAQRRINERHSLRVIFEETSEERIVITFYPARRSRYEFTHEV